MLDPVVVPTTHFSRRAQNASRSVWLQQTMFVIVHFRPSRQEYSQVRVKKKNGIKVRCWVLKVYVKCAELRAEEGGHRGEQRNRSDEGESKGSECAKFQRPALPLFCVLRNRPCFDRTAATNDYSASSTRVRPNLCGLSLPDAAALVVGAIVAL